MWPPTLDELKIRMKIELTDTRDDERLTQDLDAAVAFVERVRPGIRYDSTDPAQLEMPEPTPDLRLGTLMLAARWQTRVRSPDGMISMAEMGSTRVSTFDGDIDRLLRIGRHRKPGIG